MTIKINKCIFAIYGLHKSYNYWEPWNAPGQLKSNATSFAVKHKNKVLIITNEHTVANYININILKDGVMFPAEVIKLSAEFDLAILDVTDRSFYDDIEPLELATKNIERLSDIIIYGFFGFPNPNISVTKGIISSVTDCITDIPHVNNYCVQIDATIAPGSSGGPVLDTNNNIVGVSYATRPVRDAFIHYCIPHVIVRFFLDKEFDGICSLYVDTQPVLNDGMKKALKASKGLLVTKVLKGPTSSEKVPFEVNDVILEIDKYIIYDNGNTKINEDFVTVGAVVNLMQPDKKYKAVIVRKGEKKTIDVSLPIYKSIIPSISSEYNSKYAIIFGFAFVQLTQMALNEIVPERKGFYCNIIDYARRAEFDLEYKEEYGYQEILVHSTTFPNIKNRNYPFNLGMLHKVNGERIYNMKHLVKHCESQVGKASFLDFEFESSTRIMIDISDLNSKTYAEYNISICKKFANLDRYYLL